MAAPAPIEQPDIIIPDAGPLIHLAQADALSLLHQVGRRVVVADMVAYEVTQDMGKPGAERLRDWLEAGRAAGSNAPVSVEETSTGRLFALARQVDPTVHARDAGERAIVDWLAEKIQGTDLAVMVVYENARVPRIVANQGMDADIDVVTTRAFLQLAQQAGTTPAAIDYWKRIVAMAPAADDAQSTTMHRRSRS